MYHELEAAFRDQLEKHIQQRYGIEIAVTTDRPPKIAMGEVATPVCFELAKRLKRAPRQIAQEVANELAAIRGLSRIEVAGAGYLNAYFDRQEFFASALTAAYGGAAKSTSSGPKIVVEHTNINPNKAAHIGHLRNAALGDTFVRMLRFAGERVEVQNYIDNTGVQVADVVLGFLHLEKKSAAEVRALAASPKFDYYCWDLYARVTTFLEEDKSRLALRGDTLKAIEHGTGAEAQIGEIVSDAIVHRHLRTMERLGISYDVLPRESEILHLKFWDSAFTQLKERGAIHLSTAGKTAGCWIMRMPGAPGEEPSETSDDDAKIIVRSNGTVTYVGKDIAYQLWKFGLLGKDFYYRAFDSSPAGETVWTTTADAGDPRAPAFGHAHRVYNVIDSRQSYLQNVVVAGLRALGFTEQADRSTHFSYEIVALTPRCAQEMGYELSAEDAARSYVEVSGRRGLGVKADDLITKLEDAARKEVDQRHADAPQQERTKTAHQIAIGALRYFLLRFARNTIIAFDFKDALSFEGETGPYSQYAVVRIRSIFQKMIERGKELEGGRAQPTREQIAHVFSQPGSDDLWELTLLAGSLGARVDSAIRSQEPAFVAKFAFELAQTFNNFYHKHHILSEADPARQLVLLALCGLVERQLVATLALLGIDAPAKM